MTPRTEFDAPRCGCGGSTHPEIAAAIREAVAAASGQLAEASAEGDAAVDLAVVFV